MEDVGIKMSRNAQSSDIAIKEQNLGELKKFAKGVPNHCDNWHTNLILLTFTDDR